MTAYFWINGLVTLRREYVYRKKKWS